MIKSLQREKQNKINYLNKNKTGSNENQSKEEPELKSKSSDKDDSFEDFADPEPVP